MDKMSIEEYRKLGNSGKYRNTKCVYSGIKFDSKKEMMRYIDLLDQEKRGIISGLNRQVEFIVQEKLVGVRAIKIKPDFTYIEDGQQVIEDVKPLDRKTGKFRLTQAFSIKWKMLQANKPDCKFVLY